jgi:hypothetical protein
LKRSAGGDEWRGFLKKGKFAAITVITIITMPIFLTSSLAAGIRYAAFANAASSSNSIYYPDQLSADIALDSFGRDQPQCLLWTNWQKICSRTGLNGEITCAMDSGFKVRPSTPFCAGISGSLAPTPLRPSPYGPTVLDNSGNPKRILSAHRFCRSKAERKLKERDNGQDFGCGSEGYLDKRPFARPFWLLSKSGKRLVVVGTHGIEPLGSDYGDYESLMRKWCAVPAQYDISNERWNIVEDESFSQILRRKRLPMNKRFKEFSVVGVYCYLR